MFVHLLGLQFKKFNKKIFHTCENTHIYRDTLHKLYQLTFSNIGIAEMDSEMKRMKSTVQLFK